MKKNKLISKMAALLTCTFLTFGTIFTAISCSSGDSSSSGGTPVPEPEPEPTPEPSIDNVVEVKALAGKTDKYSGFQVPVSALANIKAGSRIQFTISAIVGNETGDSWCDFRAAGANWTPNGIKEYYNASDNQAVGAEEVINEGNVHSGTYNFKQEGTFYILADSTTLSKIKSDLWFYGNFKLEKLEIIIDPSKLTDNPAQNAPAITEWTLVNDFNSSSLDSKWQTADWANGGMFGCGWKPNHIIFNESNNGLMKIKLDNAKFSDSILYTGGELRTKESYGYGYYEVRMKPCKKEGTNSSFFLYAETRDSVTNALTSWNEIDIEFLGKNTRQVQFNYFLDEKGEGHEYLLQDLGFDASEDFHVYGIEYASSYIKWYVDGKLVYTAAGCTENGHNHAKGTLPDKNMQIMTNFWNGNNSADMKAWLGTFSYTNPLYAEYDYIKYKKYEN